jgi:3-phosphoshikimate 1-carboxyvinyltransferase
LKPFVSVPKRSLRGRIRVPGDKSISHRALMLAGVAVGTSRISGLLEGEDVLRTAAALQALGATVTREGDGAFLVSGVGIGGLAEPREVLDMGNSGTGARLLMGLVATHPFTSFFTGDQSLCRRPMARVTAPLSRMGAQFVSRGGRLPLAVLGAGMPIPIVERMAVPSAQVKSAILLAGLNAPGETTVIEPEPTRDHTEILLRHFGAAIESADVPEDQSGTLHARAITLAGFPELTARDVSVPGDPSSAAFPLVAAILAEEGEVTVENVGANPLRLGLYQTLKEMGADIKFSNPRVAGGEQVADITARASLLRGVDVPPMRAPSMIDEYPILAVAAAFAEGKTAMRGLGELRIKESDRLMAMAEGLASCGVKVERLEDGLIVHGTGRRPNGAMIATHFDHRIAMSFLVLGAAATDQVSIDDAAMIATSFPGFAELMNGLGTEIRPCP